MFEKMKQNQIWWHTCEGKLVNMRAKVIAWSHVMLCEEGEGLS